MPASLTGLSHDVYRVPFAKPILLLTVPPNAGVRPPVQPTSQTSTPEIYVSYAWGEDSTSEGKEREEIVNRLCEAVRASGQEIGRDKERIRAGDSIERFAQEISRAKRIVAVISAKSLVSDFCMAHELFRAYRRCDYQRAEFQEKVIALVMDDAKPFLQDDHALVSLAKHWKEKFEKLHKELREVDPNRRNHDLWFFVDLMEDMVPRLPGMLSALRDIVMKRGFEQIVADGFREVINRLPRKIKDSDG
jgi:internalin A